MKRGQGKHRAVLAGDAEARAAIAAGTVARADTDAAVAAGEAGFRTRITASLRGSRANLAGRELL